MKFSLLFAFILPLVMGTVSAQELYFEPNFVIIGNDRFENDRTFLIGDTVTIIGTSSWYDESSNKHIPIPETVFEVTINDPSGKIVFNDNFVTDDDGKLEIAFPLTGNHKIGQYKVEMLAKHEHHQKFLDLPFYVGPTDDRTLYVDSNFDLWLDESQPVIFSFVNLVGVICSDKMSKQDTTETEIVLPVDGDVMKANNVKFIANFTDPNGDYFISSGIFGKDDCTHFSLGVPESNVPGKWSAYVRAWWVDNGVLYESQSDTITFDVREPIFYNDLVEKIKLDSFSYNPLILDINKDGNKVLLKQQERNSDIAILHLKDYTITQLDARLLVGNQFVSARFSNEDFLYLQHEQELWKYFPDTKESTRILSNVSFYDILDDGRIIYSTYDEEEPSLYETNGDGSEKKFLLKDKDLWTFDVNDEGTKVVHRKVVNSGYGWTESELQIIDLETGNKHSLSQPKLSCGNTPTWSPNGELILHSRTGCGKGWPGAVLYITTADGNYTETIIPGSNHRPEFVVSPDGSFLLSTSFGQKYSDPAYLYKVTLAKPIPEFESVVMMVLLGSILPIVSASRLKIKQFFQ